MGKSVKKNLLGKISTVVLWILFVLGTGAYLVLPLWVEQYLKWKNLYTEDYYRNMLYILYPAGLCAVVLTFFTIRLMMNVNQNKAFIIANTRYLSAVSICSCLMAVIFLVAVWVLQSVLVFFMFVIFAIVSLVSLILAELFKVAIRYKEENELTI